MSSNPRSIDFDVVKEPWNKYELNDGTIIKTRIVLKKLVKEMLDKKQGKFGIDAQPVTVVLTSSEQNGPPDPKPHPPEELRQSIEKDDLRYTTLAEEWNEYIVDDGSRVRIKSTVMQISKTTKFDRNGDPIYLVDTNNLVEVKLPKL